MIESIQAIYDTIYKELKAYLNKNSIYSPYVYKKESNNKKFPVRNMRLHRRLENVGLCRARSG